MLVINGVNLVLPQIIRQGIDQGIYGSNLRFLAWAASAMLGLTLVKGIFIYFQGMWTEISSQAVAYDVRNELLSRLARLSFSFHDQSEAGQILARAMQDVERIRFLTGRAVLRIVEGAVLIGFTAIVLLWMNVTLAALVILTLPFLIYRAYIFGREYRPLALDIQNQLGVLTNQLEQNLRGAQIVKAFAQEDAESERFIAENERWFQFSAASARVQAVNAPLLDMIANFGTVFILSYGGWLVIQEAMTLGELVAFTTYLAMLVRPIRRMGRIIPVLAIAASAAQRLFAILDAPTDVGDRPGAQPLPRLKGHVRFENVSFAYQEDSVVLHDINFEVQPGQIVALMGATGSGKTSLVNLVSRFYEPTEGRITIDGYDTSQATLRSLRSQIGLVMQDTILFAATVRENIAFGRPEANDEEVMQAARDAQAHEFIANMPHGYDTRIGERGVTLSGGQKQRLAIARALLTDPRILILDDATASVDNRTERLIQAALSRLMEGRTTFVIAHRLSTVQRADLILLLDKGRIVARGSHRSLLASSSLYRQIFELQIQDHERERLLASAAIKEEQEAGEGVAGGGGPGGRGG
ncbi:MAG TPA: ABC transporter ATP-binding protein [Candidatus Sulfomarinibacteraceae bacterium]|nr:ABC transporter ATP-binding protein [Candidatus Sulfomarinibacteraceae bacterium]